MKKKFHDLLGFSYCPRTVLPAGLWCMFVFFFCDVLAVEAGFHLLISPIHHLCPLYSTSYSTSETQFQSAEAKGTARAQEMCCLLLTTQISFV